jgi:glutamate/tyrosine decarboxylase-like PLP-dependent enzyme
MDSLGKSALDWVVRHLSTLGDQPVGRTASRRDTEALLRHPAPEQGRPFADVLADFREKVVGHAFHPQHPRFLAFIPSAPNFCSVLGELLCAGSNIFAGVWLEAAGPSQVEILVLDWFKEWLGYPAAARGVLTGGGSEATLTALVAAREPLSGPERDNAVVYVSQQRHWSVDRAARVMGLRPDQVRPVEADADFRLKPDALAALVREDRAAGRHPWLVVANGGATNTGAIDPLEAVSEVCQREGLWLHVDAAYGWVAVLTAEGRRQLAGIERADSLTLDPHKWLAQTFEVGCVLVRDGKKLTDAFAMRPEYLEDVQVGEDEVNFCDHGIALTRRFRALKVWLSVEVLGVAWFRRLVEHCCRLAQLSELLLKEAGCFEILSPACLGIVCFRHRPGGEPDEEALDRWNRALLDATRESGRVFLSSTRLRGRVALRFCFVNWRTTTADVEEAVTLLRALGERLSVERV